MSLQGCIASRPAGDEEESYVRTLHLETHPLACVNPPPGYKDAVSTGTTIMALKYDGGVVLGADTRTSTGQYIANRAARKITQVTDKIFVCRSGSAADTQSITGIVRRYANAHSIDLDENARVKNVANLFKYLLYNNRDNLMAGVIIGGYDEVNGAQVYQIPLGGALLESNFAIGGSGSTFIWGLLDAEYRPNMTKEECQRFVVKLISHALTRDGSSGGMVRLVTIDKEGVHEDCVQGNCLPYGP